MKAWQVGAGALGVMAVTGAVALMWRGDVPAPDGTEAFEEATDEAFEAMKEQPGKWRKLRAAGREELSDAQSEAIAMLEAIGYADGTRAVRADKVITVHDRERAYQGLNLYNSGHEPEAYLADMDGRVLHTWSARFFEALPDSKLKPGTLGTHHWRKVRLAPNGDLYAIWEGWALIHLDAQSRVVFAVENRAHHDLTLIGDDELAVLTRKAELLKAIDERRPVLQDFIEVRKRTGELVRRVSLLGALHAGGFGDVVRDTRTHGGDITHTNSIVRLDGRHTDVLPEATAGRYLVSMRNIDAVGIVDLDTERFVWLHRGPFKAQHDARFTPEGRLMVFDNIGMGKERSRVLAMTPTGMAIAWTYASSPAAPLFSPTLGTAQPLPNGDVLVTESEAGRAVEVTPDGEIVWEMYNPHRAGEHGEFIAALFEVTRLAPDTDLTWMTP